MEKTGKRVAIIGGAGRMGRWLAGFLLEGGFEVVIADPDEASLLEAGRRLNVAATGSNVEALAEADYVVVSVPIESFAGVIREIGPGIQPSQTIIDITSTKELPVEIMHQHIRKGNMLGAHPLFGPGAGSVANKNVVLTPTNDDEKALARKISGYLEAKGARVTLMTRVSSRKTPSYMPLCR
jgi:prephenate dehydrogenase